MSANILKKEILFNIALCGVLAILICVEAVYIRSYKYELDFKAQAMETQENKARLLQTKQNDKEYIYNTAIEQLKSGKYSEGQTTLLQLLSISNYKSALLYYDYATAMVYWKEKGDISNAKKYYNRVLNANTDDYPAEIKAFMEEFKKTVK